MQIKGILFDKDGTLIDFDSVWLPAAKEVIRYLISINALEASTEIEASIYQAMGVEPDRVLPNGPLAYQTYADIGKSICNALRSHQILLDPVLVEKQLSVLFESITAREDFSFQPIGDLKGLFKQLAEFDIKIGLATADTKTSAKHCLQTLDILTAFDYLGYDDGILKPKPAGDMFFDFAGSCALKPEEIMVVGDTRNDMIFAHTCGGIGVGVLSGVSVREDFEEAADYIISTVEEIPRLLEAHFLP